MKQLSLTARLSLMFMLAVTGVLGAAGFFFYQLSQHHFDELDRHTLEDKLRAGRELLTGVDDLAQFDALRPQLQALLGGHSDLVVRIVDAKDRLLFAASGATSSAKTHAHGSVDGEVRRETRVWRRKAGVVEVAGKPLSIELALDITTHKVFLHTLAGWLWGALVLCAPTASRARH